MKALTARPGVQNSADLRDVPEPPTDQGSVLVQGLALGVCGMDREIVDGDYGWAPRGQQHLILGHESLERALEAPAGSGLSPGDLVVGIVRCPDPVPCRNCAVGEWDMCRNGRYTEHGIKELHGFGAERWRVDPDHPVKIDPRLGSTGVLMEPASILAKALGAHRAHWSAGPLGAATGSRHRRRADRPPRGPDGRAARARCPRGRHRHRRAQAGPRARPWRHLPRRRVRGSLRGGGRDRRVYGRGATVLDAMRCNAPGAVVCLTGISSGTRAIPIDAAAVNKSSVLENDVVFGSLNANRRHYEQAAASLARADPAWLGWLVTRRVPLARWLEALERRPDDVKTVIEIAA